MKPLRLRLQEARTRLGLPWEVIERDYLLSWVLAGISRTESLNDRLVFKGGTALKKCWFSDYRFSEDLDFSALGGVPTGADMETAIRGACAIAAEMIDPYAAIEILCQRHEERDPHPHGQEAFDIHARFPWHRQPQTRIMVEISTDEKILKPPVEARVLHEYGEPLEAKVLAYPLEEIVAEKLRSLLQHVRIIERRGWSRSRARDYYDLWRILREHRGRLDLAGFRAFLQAKCSLKDVGFSGPESFFHKPMIEHVERTWAQWLGPLVPGLPPHETVIGELRPMIAEILARE